MKKSMIAAAVTGFLIVIVLMGALFTVDETEQVVILQFGRPVGQPITDAGLHFKLPFIQDIKSFDKRVLEWDGDEVQIPTSDKKFVLVDTFARWRIVDALKYLQTVRGDELAAQSRLDDIIGSATRNFVSQNLLIEAVRNSNRTLQSTLEEEQGGLEGESVDLQIQQGRHEVYVTYIAL